MRPAHGAHDYLASDRPTIFGFHPLLLSFPPGSIPRMVRTVLRQHLSRFRPARACPDVPGVHAAPAVLARHEAPRPPRPGGGGHGLRPAALPGTSHVAWLFPPPRVARSPGRSSPACWPIPPPSDGPSPCSLWFSALLQYTPLPRRLPQFRSHCGWPRDIHPPAGS